MCGHWGRLIGVERAGGGWVNAGINIEGGGIDIQCGGMNIGCGDSDIERDGLGIERGGIATAEGMGTQTLDVDEVGVGVVKLDIPNRAAQNQTA